MSSPRPSVPKERRVLLIYLAAGLITWPIAAAALYWGVPLANCIATIGPPQPGIGAWTAILYALPLAVIIIVTGWLQRSRY